MAIAGVGGSTVAGVGGSTIASQSRDLMSIRWNQTRDFEEKKIKILKTAMTKSDQISDRRI